MTKKQDAKAPENLKAPLPETLVRRAPEAVRAPADAFAGQGGSYVRGADGARTRVETTKDRSNPAPAADQE